MKVIDLKTGITRTSVDKVLKWEENYLTRKEYLGNLKATISSSFNPSQPSPVSAERRLPRAVASIT